MLRGPPNAGYCWPDMFMSSVDMGGEKISDLWLRIDRHHLAYLQMEESPQKLEERQLLEEYIREYLCSVPHEHKFCTREATQVLRRSITEKPNFNFYRAQTAFDSIGAYAMNLISQPWRREFREIRMYCGFYQHQVEAHLVDARLLFGPMGYRVQGQKMILEGPVDPEKVAMVSRDCLIANVECQIMCMIWEELSPQYPCTVQDVLEFRQNHVGDATEAVRTMSYYFRQRQYHQMVMQSQHHLYSSMATPTAPPPVANTLPNHYQFDPTYNNPNLPYYCTMRHPSQLYPAPQVSPFYPGVSPFYHHHQMSPAAPQSSTLIGAGPRQHVPTERLIDVDGPEQPLVAPSSVTRQTKVVHAPKKDEFAPEPSLQVQAKDRTKVRNGDWSDSWSYVYSGLESRGYSKDLGDRGDLLANQGRTVTRSHTKSQVQTSNGISNNNTPLPRSVLELQDTLKREALEIPKTSHITAPGKAVPVVVKPTSTSTKATSAPKEKVDDKHIEFMKVLNSFESGIKFIEDESPDEKPSATAIGIASATKTTAAVIENRSSTSIGSLKVTAADSSLVTPSQTDRIREARVVTMPRDPPRVSSSSKDAPQSSQHKTMKLPPGNIARWKCPKCTYQNTEVCPTCVVCDTHRPKETSPTSPKSPVTAATPETPKPVPSAKESSDATDVVDSSPKATEGTDASSTTPAEWECVTCTFHNSGKDIVCVMCGKSKARGLEASPLASGGKQCSKCTLVNGKDARICDACGTSLNDSATYV